MVICKARISDKSEARMKRPSLVSAPLTRCQRNLRFRPPNLVAPAVHSAPCHRSRSGTPMPLDFHVRLFLENATPGFRGRYQDAEQRRAALEALTDQADPAGEDPIGGARDHLMPVHDGHVSLRVYSPLGLPARVLPAFLFFHGGGWVAGSLETHDGLCRRLSNETGCRVIAVDYRLAPE